MEFTIFGHKGFLGNEFKNYLINKKHNVFLPRRNQYKFKTGLKNVIYFIGSDKKEDILKQIDSNFVHLYNVVSNNNFKSMTFISSTRIYLNQKKKIIKENDTLNISFEDDYLFNVLKVLSEKIVLLLPNSKIIRLSNVYGRNSNHKSMLPLMINNAKMKKINISVNKFSSKDYIFIDDALEGIFKISKFGKEKIYNLASGENVSINKISKILKIKFGANIFYQNQKKKEFYPNISIEKIKKEINFKKKTNLFEYLKNVK